MMNKFQTLLAISISAVGFSAQAQLAQPGTGNGFGQPCAGQNTYGAGPCYPTAYIPTFTGAIGPTNMFTLGVQPDYYGTTPNYANSPSPQLDANGLPVLDANGFPIGGLLKFQDDLPRVGKPNAFGMELTVAIPDQVTYPGQPTPAIAQDGVEYASDYYEIGVVQYSMQMHSQLPPTQLRGYVQIETPANAAFSKHIALTYPNGNPILNLAGQPVFGVDAPNYLGPSIVAEKNRPVRVKFTNYLPPGTAGDLPFPVDNTYMGAGAEYTQNRVSVHLHGGVTPWISDGTPHQWTAPVGETNPNKRGPAVKFVPDMWFDAQGNTIEACAAQTVCTVAGATNDPGQGSLTMYYTNQQSAKMMWYHDHAYGITRLNVYDGMAAGFFLNDAVEHDLQLGTNTSGGNPGLAKLPDGMGIPLIIQDKTWVDANAIGKQDPTWAWGSKPAKGTTAGTPVTGDLWLPHVYMPNQHPTSASGVNDVGRWDYNSFLYPPITTQIIGPVTNLSYVDAVTTPNQPPLVPGTTNPVGTPEAFMDSITVNGTAWPKLSVTPNTHRFKMLNAADDRTFAFNWYVADPLGMQIIAGGTGYSQATTATVVGGWKAGPMTGTPASITPVVSGIVTGITFTPPATPAGYITAPIVEITGGGGSGAQAVATIDGVTGDLVAITVTNAGQGYTSAPTVTLIGPASDVPVATASIDTVIVDMKVNSLPSVPYDTTPTIVITDPNATATAGIGAMVLASPNTDIHTVPAKADPSFPATWPTDGRNGGVADPKAIGPKFTILANEGGWIPKPQTLPTQPVTYEYSRRVIFSLSVKEHGLVIGPAERIDTLVDFTAYKGKTVILYNDGPAPYPFFDERFDYYTGSPDNTFQGGAPSTLPGYGPNTRTVMQVNVCDPAIMDTTSMYYCDPLKTEGMLANGTPDAPFNMGNLNKSWSAIYKTAQEGPLVPNAAYNNILGTTFTGPTATSAGNDQRPNLADANFTFKPFDPNTGALSTTSVTLPVQDKAIIENWDMEYGRMNALFGGALPNMGPQAGVAQPLSYFNDPTEIVKPTFEPYPMVGTLGDGTQIWRLDHQGVDQHYMHFHLVNVQMIGRIAIDGTVFPIDPEEQGMKETIRLSPALDTFVAVRAIQPHLPWALPNSVRLLDPAAPANVLMTDSAGATLNNVLTDYGMEYVFHCHLLGHEEHDMMRPFVMVMPLNLQAPILVAGAKNTAYTPVTYVASGGLTNVLNPAAPYKFTITGGALPPGMTLNAAGTLSGTPTTIGTYNFSVTATDYSKPTVQTATVQSTLTVTANALVPSVMTATIPNGNVGNTYNQVLAVAGGTGPYTWTSTGTLPAGLTITNGVISGTPTAIGNYSFSVTAKDSLNVSSAAQAYTIAITKTTINTAVLPNGNIGIAYSQPINVTGGVAPYAWQVTGTVPSGLTFTNGTLSGTPDTAGTYNFSVTATDSANPLPTSVTQAYTITIAQSVTPAITTTSLPGGTAGTAYSQTISVVGGTAPYTWNLTGSLPTGMTLVDGLISGIPTVPGTYNFSVSVTDSKNVSSPTQAYTVTIGGTALNPVTDLVANITAATGTMVKGTTLTWTNTSIGQTGYNVEYSSSKNATWTTLTGNPTGTTTMNFTTNLALAKNVTYSFRVTPKNGTTLGGVSNTAVVDMKLKPTPPIIGTASSVAGGTVTIDVNWTDTSNNNTNFVVQRCNANTVSKVASCTNGTGWKTASTGAIGPNQTTATVKSLSNGVSYMLRVIAKNAMGNSVASTPTAPIVAQ